MKKNPKYLSLTLEKKGIRKQKVTASSEWAKTTKVNIQ